MKGVIRKGKEMGKKNRLKLLKKKIKKSFYLFRTDLYLLFVVEARRICFGWAGVCGIEILSG